MAKAAAAKPPSKTEILNTLSEATGLTKKDIAGVLEALEALIAKSLSKKGPRAFALPGLLKIKVVHKKATKARPGINPATGEQITIKAKPAKDVVRVSALKKLKEMA